MLPLSLLLQSLRQSPLHGPTYCLAVAVVLLVDISVPGTSLSDHVGHDSPAGIVTPAALRPVSMALPAYAVCATSDRSALQRAVFRQ